MILPDFLTQISSYRLGSTSILKESVGVVRDPITFLRMVPWNLNNYYPIESMYGIFTYIWLIFYGKCR